MVTERAEFELSAPGSAQLVAAIQAEERALADLQKQLQAGVISFAAFESESDKVIERLNELRTATTVTEDVLRGLGESTTVVVASMDKVSVSKEKASTASANLRTSIVATSYAIQDFSSTTGDLGAKLNSVSNNIPQILVGLGGIGTALSVGATAAIAFYRNWDSIKSLFIDIPFEFGKATTSLSELRDRIKELENKKVKVGAEYDELEKAKEAAKELVRALELAEEIRTGQAKAERESGARIKAAIAEAPGGGAAVVSALAAPREAELRAQAEAQAKREEAALEERARRAVEMELPLNPRVIEEEWNAIQSRWGARLKGIAAEAEAQVGQLLSTAIKGTGEEQARAQEALRQGLTKAGQGALAERIGGLGPMQVQGMETQEQVAKHGKEAAQEIDRAAEKFDRSAQATQQAAEAVQHAADQQDLAAYHAEQAAEKRTTIGGEPIRGGRRGGGAGGGGGGGGGGIGIGGGGGGGGGGETIGVLGAEGFGIPLLPEGPIGGARAPAPRTVEGRIAAARERRADQQRARLARRAALKRAKEERRRARPLPRALAVARRAGVPGTFGGPSEGAGMRAPAGAQLGTALAGHAQANAGLIQAQAMGLQVVRALAAENAQMRQAIARLMQGYQQIGNGITARSRPANMGRNGGL